jgi:rare lipoprotein A
MIKRIVLIVVTGLFFVSCSTAVRFSSKEYKGYDDETAQVVNVMYGKASYYGDEFNGKKTASGEMFDNGEFTAAHLSLPFGTFVRVTNLAKNKSVVVRINDRGPFVAGRVIDLTKAAAEQLDMVRAGIIDVKLEILK